MTARATAQYAAATLTSSVVMVSVARRTIVNIVILSRVLANRNVTPTSVRYVTAKATAKYAAATLTRPVVTVPVVILATAVTMKYAAVRAKDVVRIQVLIAAPIVRPVVGVIVVILKPSTVVTASAAQMISAA